MNHLSISLKIVVLCLILFSGCGKNETVKSPVARSNPSQKEITEKVVLDFANHNPITMKNAPRIVEISRRVKEIEKEMDKLDEEIKTLKYEQGMHSSVDSESAKKNIKISSEIIEVSAKNMVLLLEKTKLMVEGSKLGRESLAELDSNK